MTISFNLIKEAWIPCLTLQGKRVEINMRETLQRAQELKEIDAESSITTAALYRLLLAVLHRTFNGPDDLDEWQRIYKIGNFKTLEVEQYLDRIQPRFDLFDADHPFMQAPAWEREPKSIASLIQGVAAGADATLFSHRTEETDYSLTFARAARAVVTTQAFGLAGLAGGGSFTDAACTRLVVLLVEGKNLFETLMFNLSAPEMWGECGFSTSKRDIPAWEMDDPYEVKPDRPYGYMDYLTWQNRRIQLLAQEDGVHKMRYHIGLRLPEELLNPMAHYFRDKKGGLRPLRFSEGRSLWRDSAALFELSTNDVGNLIPRSIKWMQILRMNDILPRGQIFRLAAFGMSTKPGQDKVYFIHQERLPLPEAYLNPRENLGKILKALEALAEDACKQLWGALKRLAGLILTDEEDNNPPPEADGLITHWGVERRYWAELEAPFERLVLDLPDHQDEAVNTWKESIRGVARTAFAQAQVAIGESPRAWKAITKARSQLEAGLAKVLTKKEATA